MELPITAQPMDPGSVLPTHWCLICGALWAWVATPFGPQWISRSRAPGRCCLDNQASGHLEKL